MYEIMKLKYRKILNENSNINTISLLENILTEMQSILIKNEIYQEQQLLKQIEKLKDVDSKLYNILYNDIKNNNLFNI